MNHTAYIFDIDNTIADCTHRLHFIQPPAGKGASDFEPDWDTFYRACVDDKPIDDVIDMYTHITGSLPTQIFFITGRPERVREQTKKWLHDNISCSINDDQILMRRDGDWRPDYQIKRELYERKIKDNYEVCGVFEDRQQCVDMWRKMGLTCFQVAKGDY